MGLAERGRPIWRSGIERSGSFASTALPSRIGLSLGAGTDRGSPGTVPEVWHNSEQET
jgi:hypothetical protein